MIVMTEQRGIYGELVEIDMGGTPVIVPKFMTEMRKERIFSKKY